MQSFAQSLILDLPREEAVNLYLRATTVQDNPLQARLGLIDWNFGVDKMKMLHLRSNSANLQPKRGCAEWNPTVRAGLDADTIRVTDYEVNGEQCPDEFNVGTSRLLRGPLGQGEAPGVPDPLTNALLTMLRRSLAGDLYDVVYFSDENIRQDIAATAYPDSPVLRERFLTMLEQQSGIWPEIIARTTTTNKSAKIAYVDSNDGTAAGNATRAENIADFFDDMAAAASPELANWHQSNQQGTFDKPVFLVQTGLWRAYKKYLRTLGTEIAHQFILDGEIMRDTLMHDGYLVVHVPEWEAHDRKAGRATVGNMSTTQRALFTVLGNITGLANMNDIEGQPGRGLAIQRSPLLKDKGKMYMYADYGIGMGVAQPELMVASYNSSTNFA